MSHDKDRYISYVEMSMGVGDMVGPAIGAFIFQFVGYVGTFLFFTLMVVLGIIVSIVMIPNSFNNTRKT
jgi:predicted MFS family arabinose efflux permease